MRTFAWFCHTHFLLIPTPHSTHTHTLPRSGPGVLACYLCYLCKADYMLGAIKQYLSIARACYRERRQPDPMIDIETGHTAVEPLTIMRSIKRLLRGQGRQRYPITRTMIERMSFNLGHNSTILTGAPDYLLALNCRAAMCAAWLGLLRCSELTMKGQIFDPRNHVSRKDVPFWPPRADPQYVEITIPNSKVGPDPLIRQGFVVKLCATKGYLCPVRTMLELFERDPGDSLNRPLFDFRTKDERAARCLPRPARHRLSKHVSAALTSAGCDDTTEEGKHISTHSFRCGGGDGSG